MQRLFNYIGYPLDDTEAVSRLAETVDLEVGEHGVVVDPSPAVCYPLATKAGVSGRRSMRRARRCAAAS